jgi:hypothetical protein
MKYILTLFCFISAFSFAAGQCPAWDSLGLGVSHSDNIGLLRLTCPELYGLNVRRQVLVYSFDAKESMSLLLSPERNYLIGFSLENLVNQRKDSFLLDKPMVIDNDLEFAINVLSSQSSHDFSRFKFLISIADRMFRFNVYRGSAHIELNEITENHGDYLRVNESVNNQLSYLKNYKQLDIGHEVEEDTPSQMFSTIRMVSINNDTISFRTEVNEYLYAIYFLSDSSFYVHGNNTLWLVRFDENSISKEEVIVENSVVVQTPYSEVATRGVKFIRDSLSNVVGYMNIVEDSIMLTINEKIVHTITSTPEFLRFRHDAYIISDSLFFYTQEKIENYPYFEHIVVSRLKSHIFPLRGYHRSRFDDSYESTIDGEWEMGDVNTQTFFNDYQKGNYAFRIWGPKTNHESFH